MMHSQIRKPLLLLLACFMFLVTSRAAMFIPDDGDGDIVPDPEKVAVFEMIDYTLEDSRAALVLTNNDAYGPKAMDLLVRAWEIRLGQVNVKPDSVKLVKLKDYTDQHSKAALVLTKGSKTAAKYLLKSFCQKRLKKKTIPDPGHLQKLIGFGFDERVSRDVLVRTNNNFEKALNLVVSLSKKHLEKLKDQVKAMGYMDAEIGNALKYLTQKATVQSIIGKIESLRRVVKSSDPSLHVSHQNAQYDAPRNEINEEKKNEFADDEPEDSSDGLVYKA
eukprot:448015_1